LGYRPVLEHCTACGGPVEGRRLAFSAMLGGVVCGGCQAGHRDSRPLSAEAWQALRTLSESGDAWQRDWPQVVRGEVRQLLGQYATYILGRRPRLLPYLGSGYP